MNTESNFLTEKLINYAIYVDSYIKLNKISLREIK